MSSFISSLPRLCLPIGRQRHESWLAPFRRNRVISAAQSPLLLERDDGTQTGVRVYRRILVAVDFSAATSQILRLAHLAAQCAPGVQLTFLHAFTLEAGSAREAIHQRRHARQQALQRLDSMLADLRQRCSLLSVVVQHGAPHAMLACYAQRMQADLVILGTLSNHSPLRDFRRGPAEQLMRRAGCDVLLIPAACCPDLRQPSPKTRPPRLART